jgi:hypothetical protein
VIATAAWFLFMRFLIRKLDSRRRHRLAGNLRAQRDTRGSTVLGCVLTCVFICVLFRKCGVKLDHLARGDESAHLDVRHARRNGARERRAAAFFDELGGHADLRVQQQGRRKNRLARKVIAKNIAWRGTSSLARSDSPGTCSVTVSGGKSTP